MKGPMKKKGLRRRRAKPILACSHMTERLPMLWALRMLAELRLYPEARDMSWDLLNEAGWRPAGMAPSDEAPGTPAFMAHAREAIEGLEAAGPGLSPVFERNMDLLADRLGLSEVECRLLALAIYFESTEALGRLAGWVEGERVRPHRLPATLGVILDLPEREVARAISPDGRLSRTGLLMVDPGASDLAGALDPMPELSSTLMVPHASIDGLLSQYFSPVPVPVLRLEDYPHLEAHIGPMMRYLEVAVREGLDGVNVLLYGPPGTGKSELARVLGRAIGTAALDVASTDESGDPLDGGKRQRAYRLAQSLLAERGASLLVMDEAEEVFDEIASGPFGRTSYRPKAWINRILEDNPVPAIWICNQVGRMDPAYLRRFDFIVELPVPLREVRYRILQNALDGLAVRSEWLDRLSRVQGVAPAMLTRAARVVRRLGVSEPLQAERLIEDRLNDWRRASGLGPIKTVNDSILEYRLDSINTDPPLQPTIEGLARNGFGRLCLYGPPGTGKTAFARYLADALGRELMVMRASDLLDKYLGQTEQKIAAMFYEATQDDAVLLLDEVDSLLSDRAGAHRRWEVSQVNELLTGLEAFEGVFIATTNRLEALDRAVLRRFDLKVRFRPLSADQAWQLFQSALADPEGVPETPWRSRLARLDDLTPGDFATVMRRLKFSGQPPTPARLLDGLTREHRVRVGHQGHGIGFQAEIA